MLKPYRRWLRPSPSTAAIRPSSPMSQLRERPAQPHHERHHRDRCQRADFGESSAVAATSTSPTAPPRRIPNGQILPFNRWGTNCALNSIAGGAVDNISPAQNPVYTLTEARAAASSSTLPTRVRPTATTPNSSISVFTIDQRHRQASDGGRYANPLHAAHRPRSRSASSRTRPTSTSTAPTASMAQSPALS